VRAKRDGSVERCQFVGDANTVKGRVVPCRNAGTVVMRVAGVEALAALGQTKPVVCDEHMRLMLSASCTRAWQIDHFVKEGGRAVQKRKR
jgi:hypothetical protein